jgi:hypothetical protein
VGAPRLLERLGVREVLAMADQRLLGEVIPAFLDREHRAPLPVLGLLELAVGLVTQPLLVGDRARDLLLRPHELRAHVDDDLVEHLLGVFRRGDEVVDVRAEQR